MTFRLLLDICALFLGLFAAGTLACLPLYHWQLHTFLTSRVWVKVYWWIPIFAVFCTLLYVRGWGAWPLMALLAVQAIHEIIRRHAADHWYTWAYFCLFALGLLHLPMLFMYFSRTTSAVALISICFASVLSDVCAFFAGSYAGSHHLPASINARKSYEGVAGQIGGAFIGLGLVALLPGVSFHWPLALGIGVASASGDIINSAVKRACGIIDWGDTIPGHGGVLDRFASLSLAFAAGYWVLRLLGY